MALKASSNSLMLNESPTIAGHLVMGSASHSSTATRNRRGDPERRKALNIHTLVKKLSASNKPSDTYAISTTGSAENEKVDAHPSSDPRAQAQQFVSSDFAPGRTERETHKENCDEMSLFMFDFGECDARRCTGRRLFRHEKINKICASGRAVYRQRAQLHAFDGETRHYRSRSSSRESNGETTALRTQSSSSSDEGNDADGSVRNSDQAIPAKAENQFSFKESVVNSHFLRVRLRGGRFKGCLLSPHFDARTPLLSPADSAIIRKHGLAVVDCSWNRVLEGESTRKICVAKRNVRFLPFLLCANPTHYGTPNILTCAEALAGALHITGFRRHANLLMSSFTWGRNFFDLNQELLYAYVAVPNSAVMKQLNIQQEAEIKQKQSDKKQYNEAIEASGDGGYNSVYLELDARDN